MSASPGFPDDDGFNIFVTRLRGLAQKLIDIANLKNDFINIESHMRDYGYGLFSLRPDGGFPTATDVQRRAISKLKKDAYLHSGRKDEVLSTPSCQPCR
jgi:hypothetical protein